MGPVPVTPSAPQNVPVAPSASQCSPNPSPRLSSSSKRDPRSLLTPPDPSKCPFNPLRRPQCVPSASQCSQYSPGRPCGRAGGARIPCGCGGSRATRGCHRRWPGILGWGHFWGVLRGWGPQNPPGCPKISSPTQTFALQVLPGPVLVGGGGGRGVLGGFLGAAEPGEVLGRGL